MDFLASPFPAFCYMLPDEEFLRTWKFAHSSVPFWDKIKVLLDSGIYFMDNMGMFAFYSIEVVGGFIVRCNLNLLQYSINCIYLGFLITKWSDRCTTHFLHLLFLFSSWIVSRKMKLGLGKITETVGCLLPSGKSQWFKK